MVENSNSVVLSAEANGLLQHVKKMFEEVTNNKWMTDEDVIVTLLAWFVDGMQPQNAWGCCSDDSDCCSDDFDDSEESEESGCCSNTDWKKWACCSDWGWCSGNCAC